MFYGDQLLYIKQKFKYNKQSHNNFIYIYKKGRYSRIGTEIFYVIIFILSWFINVYHVYSLCI